MRSHQIPLALAPFVGRAQELGALAELLGRPEIRLLTLTGAGGSGKTRLAFEAVRRIASAAEDGLVLVDLAPLADPALVGPAIVQALDLPNDTQGDALLAALRDRALLLLLDNFEHLLDATPLVVRLLAECPRLHMLITSRAVLGVSGEHVFVVPPLPVDDAVRLFMERAHAADAALPATALPVAAVQQICLRLDGLPLAIELAAARVRVLPPQALLARLDARLSLLTGGGRGRPARQQAMRNTIHWSVSLLTPAEQHAFRTMAVCRGGWTLEAAAVLIGGEPLEVLDLMTSLVDKSLVECHHQPAGSEPRFRMLETLREFGREQLAAEGRLETVEYQHARYLLSIAEPRSFSPAHGQEPRGPERHQWLERVEAELDNFRSALTWALGAADRANLGLSLALGLLPFWEERGYWTEGRAWLERCIGQVTEDEILLARGLSAAGCLAYFQDDMVAARRQLEGSIALWRQHDSPTGLVPALRMLARVANVAGDFGQARVLLEEAIALATRVDLRLEVGLGYNVLGRNWLRQGETAAARTCLERGLAVMREIDYLPGTALLLWGLGETAEQEDDLEAAYATYAAALAISRQAADHKETPRCLLGMARVLLKRGSAGADVQALLTECTQLFRDQGAQTALAEAEQLTSQLAQATAERPRGGSLPDGLTVREAEIVRLIATGASNSRIAAELVVSVRTIERHIENIYAKLDVHGRSARAAVASYAIRTGLSPASTPPDTRTTSRTYASVRMS